MLNRRPLSVWLLLVFLAGGLLAPAVHRVQHGLDRWEEVSCHAAAVHRTDTPLWVDGATAIEALDCALCTSRLLAAGPPSVPPVAPTAARATLMPSRAHLVALSTEAHRYIRGPPIAVSSTRA